jgi:hypothetical protein
MKHVDTESPSDVARWLRSESTSLWPALLGSLSLRRSRCIRKNCPACQSGEQHQSYVLYGRANGRRVAVYVPEELVIAGLLNRLAQLDIDAPSIVPSLAEISEEVGC